MRKSFKLKKTISYMLAMCMIVSCFVTAPALRAGAAAPDNTAARVIEIARYQLGRNYKSYAPSSASNAWCAYFASWCFRQAGVPESSVPSRAGCTDWSNYFKKEGRWRAKGATPMPGDLLFLDYPNRANINHVGIVEKVSGGKVYAIAGNSGLASKVAVETYTLNNSEIHGYGIPKFNISSGNTPNISLDASAVTISKSSGAYDILLKTTDLYTKPTVSIRGGDIVKLASGYPQKDGQNRGWKIRVNPLKAGFASVVITQNGKSATCSITVK